MFLLLFVILSLCLAIWVGIRWKRVRRYWAEKGIPYSPPHPIMGSLTFLQKDNPATWMRKLYNTYRSPYVGVWLFWRPALVIQSPDIARRVLVKDADIFKNRFLSSGQKDPVGGLNLFTVNDPLWSSIRRRLTVVFTAAKLRALQNITSRKGADLVQRINNERSEPQPVGLKTLCTDYATDVIGESAFGVSSNATITGKSAMREVTKDFMTFTVYRGLAWSSIFFLPDIVDLFGFSLFPKRATDYLRSIFRTVVEQRGGYDNQNIENRDLLDALLKIRLEAKKDNEDISEDVLLAQAAIFLQGGAETTGVSITFTIYELAFYPEYQERVYKELMEAKQSIGDKKFNAALLSELTYLNCVIKETLRKYPPLGWLDRIASEDYRIDESLTIPAGTVTYVNAVGIHFDPEYYPDPEKFDPDRFLPDSEQNIKPYTFMPFGEGPRHCIGKRFAYQTIRYGLAAILLNYELRPLPGAPKPNDCHIESKGLLLTPGAELHVEFIPRHSTLHEYLF